jgi:hypothetical protein
MVFDDLEMSGFGYHQDRSMIIPSSSHLDNNDLERMNMLKAARRESQAKHNFSPRESINERKAALLKQIEDQVMGGLSSSFSAVDIRQPMEGS